MIKFLHFAISVAFTFISVFPANMIAHKGFKAPLCAYVVKADKVDPASFDAFREAVGHRESSNNYRAVNNFGFIGKYQFGRSALKDLGIECKNKNLFLDHEDLQDKAFEAYCQINKYRLRGYLKYVGKKINNIEITESGLLAAAHLVGAGNVRRYLKTNGQFIKKDAYGTNIEDYLILFANYRVDSIQPERVINVSNFL